MESVVYCCIVFAMSAAAIASLLLFWNDSSLTEPYRLPPQDTTQLLVEEGATYQIQERKKTSRLLRLLVELAACPLCQSYHLAYLILLFVTVLVPTEMLPENRFWLATWWLPLQAAGLALYRRI